MAEIKHNVNCGFFDAVNDDRLYLASEMNKPYKRIISNGVFATPQGTPSTDLQVISANDGMNIIVKKGEGLFGDKWFENPTDIAITIPNNTSIVPRIDSVIAQVDNTINGRVGNIIYRTGEPSSNPTAPELVNQNNISEYRIANIYVSASAVSVSQANITDLRGSAECPWVTGLLTQVDTSMLFRQWQVAYENYYNTSTSEFSEYEENRKAEFDQFINNLTSELSVATNVIMLTSNYISKETVTNIPINIPSYNPTTDVLMVFINGLRTTEELNYSINSNKTSIDLKVELLKGQAVNFLVLKSVIAADIQTTVTMIQELNNKFVSLQNAMNAIESGVYVATGIDDNKKISEIVQTFLSSSDYSQLKLNIYGDITCTTPAKVTTNNNYWFDFGNNTNKKIMLDFSNCNKITIDNNGIENAICFNANKIEISNMQVELNNCTNAKITEGNFICTNCSFGLNEKSNGTGNLVVANQGTFNNCDVYVKAESGTSYGFNGNGNILNLNNCKVIAYNNLDSLSESVAIQVQDNASNNVLIMNNCNCPIISLDNYKQSNTVKINNGLYCLTGNILGKAVVKNNSGDGMTEIGTMIINKD